MSVEKLIKDIEWSLENDRSCSMEPDARIVKLLQIIRVQRETINDNVNNAVAIANLTDNENVESMATNIAESLGAALKAADRVAEGE